MKHLGLEVKGIFTLTYMTLAEDHLSKTKSQLSVVKTFGPLVLNHFYVKYKLDEFLVKLN